MKSKALSALSVICCAMLLFTASCSDNNEKNNAEPCLATVGGTTIPTEALKQGLAERPLGSKNDSVAAAVRNRLDEMILEELLYQEAITQKIKQDPLVQQAIRQLLIGKLLETRVEKAAWDAPVSPDQTQAYYEAHNHEFTRPEQVRLADIFIAVPKDAGERERKGLLQRAESILAQAQAGENERGAFDRLIQRYSDTPVTYSKGDTGFFDKQGGPIALDRHLVQAAFLIEKNGGITGEVLEALDGFHIIRRIAKRAAVHTPLSKVENRLEQQIRRERLEAERRNYFTAVREKAKIKIDEQALSAIVRDVEEKRTDRSRTEKKRQARSAQGSTPPMPVE